LADPVGAGVDQGEQLGVGAPRGGISLQPPTRFPPDRAHSSTRAPGAS
jgi:hypothetical protein